MRSTANRQNHRTRAPADRSRRCLVASVPLLALVTLGSLVAEDSWPRFRGAGRDGHAITTGSIAAWPKEGPVLAWKSGECGQGYAGVVVSQGFVVTAGVVENETRILAFGLDGKLRWQQANGSGAWKPEAGKRKWAAGYGGSRATPTIADGVVYHLGHAGRLAAYRLADGTPLWHRDLDRDFAGSPNEWGYSESVLVEDGVLYCQPGGAQAQIVCLDAKDGKDRWRCAGILDEARKAPDTASNASGVLVEIAGVRQFVTMTTRNVVGVEAASGKLLWTHRHANRFAENCEIPQYAAGILWVSSGYRHGSEGYRIERGKDGAFSATQVWREGIADNLHGGPIAIDGFLYGAGYDHAGAWCLEIATGMLRWRDPAIRRSSFVRVGTQLIVLGENGSVQLCTPAPDPQKRLQYAAGFSLPGKGLCLTHPVWCDGRLYLRRGPELFCYELAAGQKPGPASKP